MSLLLVSIGPVQEFIASGRRCGDLWLGSWMLSEVSKAAAQAIAEAGGGTECLVFPGATAVASLNPGSNASVANKILARFTGDVGEARRAAEAGRLGMMKRLHEIRDDAFSRVGKGRADREKLLHLDVAQQQVDALIEYAWVAVPDTAVPYPEARKEAERLLAARKNTRVFAQPPWAKEGVPKSSLDGVRESVLDEAIFDRPRQGQRCGLSAEERRKAFGVHGAERLCGVGLMKRFGRITNLGEPEQRARFFSTSHVAAIPFIRGIEKATGAPQAWAEFCDDLEQIHGEILERLDVVPGAPSELVGRIDGSCFYPERLAETLEELGLSARGEQARQLLSGFLREVKKGEPGAYYAILLADGDNMGAAIDRQESVGAHQRLSQRLETFAAKAREVIVRHEGSLVYSGGDDVLAFVPLHKVLACAAALAADFRERLSEFGGGGGAPTLSVGVAIVHHLMPLDEALDKARDAERMAKGHSGKNALAITVNKRGGAPVSVVGTWGVLDPVLRKLVVLHRRDAVPAKAQYELMELSRLVSGGLNAQQRSELRNVQQHEMRRILARKEIADEETRTELEGLAGADDGGPEALGRALYVSQLIAQAEELAGEVLA